MCKIRDMLSLLRVKVKNIFAFNGGSGFLMQLLYKGFYNNMTQAQLTTLIRKYLSGEANEQEKLQIEQWYESFDTSSLEFVGGDSQMTEESLNKSLKALRAKIAQEHSAGGMPSLGSSKRIFRWWQAAAAATVLVVAAGVILSLWNQQRKKTGADMAVQTLTKDFQPGGNNAVLTLANGRQIVLDSAGNGLISTQGNARIIKVTGGLLTYNRQSSNVNGESSVQYNTITTPRGGRYEVILPDGSKVWLNAASSLRFPTIFIGDKREVEMTGEAYFEIARNASMPFVVKKGSIEVTVLGTDFNVNAYDDESNLKVTLVEGLVRVSQVSTDNRQSTTRNSQLLKPGQQLILSLSKDGGAEMNLQKDADVNEAVAWKNNLFWFDSDNIQEVCKQLSRWYNVNISIHGNVHDLFTGSIPRDLPFSKVFEVLQKTGSIQYKIEDVNTIIVTPGNQIINNK